MHGLEANSTSAPPIFPIDLCYMLPFIHGLGSSVNQSTLRYVHLQLCVMYWFGSRHHSIANMTWDDIEFSWLKDPKHPVHRQ